MLQIIELAEQMGFLFARQQRHLVQAGQIGRQAAGEPGFLGRVVGRQRTEDLALGAGLGKLRVRNVVQRQLGDPRGAHFVDHAVDAGLGAAILLGQRFGRRAATELLINALLGIGRQGTGALRKNRQPRMLAIELFERITHRLHAPAHFSGNATGDLGGATAGTAQTPRSLDNLFPFGGRQLTESRSRGASCSPLRATKLSTELFKNPTRLRPSNTNRRLTSPCWRQREMVLVET